MARIAIPVPTSQDSEYNDRSWPNYADAVREAGRPVTGLAGPIVEATRPPGEAMPTGFGRETGRRGHLRVLTSE